MANAQSLNTRNLVIGVVRGYEFSQLWPFIHSLRRTGYKGDIVLVYNDLSLSTMTLLKAAGVKLWHIYYHGVGAANSWSFQWQRFVRLTKRLPGYAGAHFISKLILPLQTARFLHYYDYLIRHCYKYQHVLLTDIRDVFFQRDPFVGFSDGLEAFQESGEVLLKDEEHNARWIVELFGPPGLAKVGDYPVLCSGTIMGDIDSVLGFLKQYECLLYEARSIYLPGSDQGIYNYLCRVWMPEKIRVIENGMGRVLTLGTLHDSDTRLFWNADGELLSANGLPAPLVHQYDRHKSITKQLLAKLTEF